MPIFVFFFTACTIGFGWCLEKRTNIAGPLALLFVGLCRVDC
jgi:hypothetical protein